MSRGRGRSERILVAVGSAGRGGSRTGHSVFYRNSWLPGVFPTSEPASPSLLLLFKLSTAGFSHFQ